MVTGLRTTIPPIDGLADVPYLTSRTLLDLAELPAQLIVVGGGYIGCEFAQMFRRFGSRVTVVHRGERLLPAEDPDISAAVADGFAADGIDVRTKTRGVAVAGKSGDIRVGCEGAAADEIRGTHLLVAVGRTPKHRLHRPRTPVCGAGSVRVPDRRRHPAHHRRGALGDIRGGQMFTHTARDDADVAYRTAFRDADRSIGGRIVPHAVFVDPEVGAVGLTEPEARAAGYDVIIGRQDFTGVAKARAIGSTRGLIKFVVDGATDRIVGCHIAGPDGGNLVHEAVIAMKVGASTHRPGPGLHVHPALAEGVNAAAGGVHHPAG